MGRSVVLIPGFLGPPIQDGGRDFNACSPTRLRCMTLQVLTSQSRQTLPLQTWRLIDLFEPNQRQNVFFPLSSQIVLVTVVAMVIPELLTAKPADQSRASDQTQSQMTNGSLEIASITSQQLLRARRQLSGAIKLKDLCPNASHTSYDDTSDKPCTHYSVLCRGYTDMVCSRMSPACSSSIPQYGYAKCEPKKQNILILKINGQRKTVVQTLSCGCA